MKTNIFMFLFLTVATEAAFAKTEMPPKTMRKYTIKGKTYQPKSYEHYEEIGTASWYGPYFDTRKTASGEVFYRNQLSAAHKLLPLPSLIKVTNLENGLSIVLKVNDRGPFIGDRLIDVSEQAAESLGFKEKGLAKVKVTLIKGEMAS